MILPPRQNTCRAHRTPNPGALMEEQVGQIRRQEFNDKALARLLQSESASLAEVAQEFDWRSGVMRRCSNLPIPKRGSLPNDSKPC